jgi:hypothetical protein
LFKGHGVTILWNNIYIGALVAIADEGYTERKSFTPDSLGLTGKEFSSMANFKTNIITGIRRIEHNTDISNCLISMLDNVDGTNNAKVLDCNFLSNNLNKITSDYGEVLAAYNSVVNGKTIKFPTTSNNAVADYYENNIPVSAKGRKAGGKVNLANYKEFIPETSDIGQFLLSLANHDRNKFFEYGAKLCKEAKIIAGWAGGTTVLDVEKYVVSTTYDEFYTKIANMEEFNGLGIPLESKDSRPKELWQKGDTNPFYFTLNTIIHRLWGVKHIPEITDLVSKFLSGSKFIHVDIVDFNIIFTETLFENVSNWSTEYHSRSTKAWHNWMAIQSTGN